VGSSSSVASTAIFQGEKADGKWVWSGDFVPSTKLRRADIKFLFSEVKGCGRKWEQGYKGYQGTIMTTDHKLFMPPECICHKLPPHTPSHTDYPFSPYLLIAPLHSIHPEKYDIGYSVASFILMRRNHLAI